MDYQHNSPLNIYDSESSVNKRQNSDLSLSSCHYVVMAIPCCNKSVLYLYNPYDSIPLVTYKTLNKMVKYQITFRFFLKSYKDLDKLVLFHQIIVVVLICVCNYVCSGILMFKPQA